ncbi:transketolase [Desulfurococcaceae archaeon AG1]|jgi:transketolase|nr:transketolase [Desulfurococcaceae archaeon AG1]
MGNGKSIEDLELLAIRIRKHILRMYLNDQSLHLGSSLSSVEILTTVVFKYLRRTGDPINRDWLILSKGHAAPALYAALAEAGLIPFEELERIHSINSILQGHPEISIPGVDMSTGSLGQGLSFGVGVATAIKIHGGSGRVYVIMGDGEQDEGEVWEAMTHAAARKLDNLVVVVDNNGFQLDGFIDDIKPKHYLPHVWRAVGWRVHICDGHSIASIDRSISDAINSKAPTIIFAKTVRGKGVVEIENTKSQKPGVEVVKRALINA